MSAGRSFHLGYSTITWGSTPELDKVFGTIADQKESLHASATNLGCRARCRRLRRIW